jgi:uncharacterized cupredoxin-like copper-binding protein
LYRTAVLIATTDAFRLQQILFSLCSRPLDAILNLVKRFAFFLVVAAVVAVVLINFGTGHNASHSYAEHRLIVVDARDMNFHPSTITVEVGETVRLAFRNHDAFLHDFVVDNAAFIIIESEGHEHEGHGVLSVGPAPSQPVDREVMLSSLHVAMAGKKQAQLIFEAVEPGEYDFYCSVPGHRQLGMSGKLIVTSPAEATSRLPVPAAAVIA